MCLLFAIKPHSLTDNVAAADTVLPQALCLVQVLYGPGFCMLCMTQADASHAGQSSMTRTICEVCSMVGPGLVVVWIGTRALRKSGSAAVLTCWTGSTAACTLESLS